MSHAPYTIRDFEPHDAEACFRIRTDAFVKLFYAEMGPQGVAAGINAYLPNDYVRLAKTSPTFVAVEEEVVVGFAALRFVDDSTAGIRFLYVRLDRTGRGIGRALVGSLEDFVRKEHPRIERMVLNTAVPRYNQAFYERLGFVSGGESVVQYPDGPVTAIRLVKALR
jgi:ribosomal protein S18 acetylase RimI-like enzyme